jgi:8-oxo-dGTP diphosphatase
VSDSLDVALAIPILDGKLLVTRRAAGSHLAGTWEFPGGKVEAGEQPATAAGRELREETGLVAPALEPLLVLVHEYPERSVRLHVFLVREPGGDLSIDGAREWAWKSLSELSELEMPAANARILRALRWRVA